MIKFGIIGTNWISGDFVKAIQSVNECKVSAVYSRKKETAEEFIKKYKIENCEIFINLDDMAKSNFIDAVYVGSPNSLHGKQSLICLENKKHVICEKPIVTKSEDLKKMIETAKKNGVVLMEAMKTTFLPNMFAIRENLYKVGDIRNIVLNYSQYSSRYDQLKKVRLQMYSIPSLTEVQPLI